MLRYRLGTVNDFHWGFKPVLSYSKPHTFSTFFGEEKERNLPYSNKMFDLNYVTCNEIKCVPEAGECNLSYKEPAILPQTLKLYIIQLQLYYSMKLERT